MSLHPLEVECNPRGQLFKFRIEFKQGLTMSLSEMFKGFWVWWKSILMNLSGMRYSCLSYGTCIFLHYVTCQSSSSCKRSNIIWDRGVNDSWKPWKSSLRIHTIISSRFFCMMLNFRKCEGCLHHFFFFNFRLFFTQSCFILTLTFTVKSRRALNSFSFPRKVISRIVFNLRSSYWSRYGRRVNWEF